MPRLHSRPLLDWLNGRLATEMCVGTSFFIEAPWDIKGMAGGSVGGPCDNGAGSGVLRTQPTLQNWEPVCKAKCMSLTLLSHMSEQAFKSTDCPGSQETTTKRPGETQS